MKLKLVSRIELEKSLRKRGILLVNFIWITPATPYRLVPRQWFFDELGPTLNRTLSAFKLGFNPGEPAWNCFHQSLTATMRSKMINVRSGGLGNNVAIGTLTFQRTPPNYGHAVIIGFDENIEFMLWDLTGKREYTLTREETAQCDTIII